jgi:hypothetical protein
LAASPNPRTIRLRLESLLEVPAMRVVCAWCGEVLSDAAGPVSHGICASCSMVVERAFHASLAARSRPHAARRPRAGAGSTLPLPGFLPDPV